MCVKIEERGKEVKKPELLAPVGKIENAYAAVENGADAIFVGGKVFNARQYADNFTDNELEQIIKYCKTRDVKIYITLNTLIKNEELEKVFEYVTEFGALAPDAVIVQDFGLARLLNRHFPTLKLHASTQMSAHSLQDVLFLKECSFKRVVLARELQLESIAQITESSGVEIETFVHGALCYAYSGQCLHSSLIGSRSGNRGRCAQPCRMNYRLLEGGREVVKDLHLMSLKDLCALPLLKEVLLGGVDSLKIEGRMKSAEYVASVVSSYRKAIDEIVKDQERFVADEQDIEKMQSIFNRGGFTTGYFKQSRGADMLSLESPKNIGLPIGTIKHFDQKTKIATIETAKALHPGDGLEIWNKKKHTGVGIEKEIFANSVFKILLKEFAEKDARVYRSKNHRLLKELKKTYEKSERKIPIQISFCGEIGETMTLKLSYKETTVEAKGSIVEKASNYPTSREAVKKQLNKMGSTPFSIETSQIDWDEEGFCSITALNELRREAARLLEEALCEAPPFEKPIYVPKKPTKQYVQTSYTAKVETFDQLQAVIQSKKIKEVYFEWSAQPLENDKAYEACKKHGISFYFALPLIMQNKEWETSKEEIASWKTKQEVGFLIRTYGQYSFLQDAKGKKSIDYTLNVLNQEALDHWLEKGANRVTLSLELSEEEVQAFGGEAEKIIYGKIPTMLTSQCILGNTNKCIKGKKDSMRYVLVDRKEEEWDIKTDCTRCRMDLYTRLPMWIKKKKVEGFGLPSYRFSFTTETKQEVEEVLKVYFEGAMPKIQVQEDMFLKSVQ